MTRKAHEPTDKDRKQVTLMAGIGLTHDQIAKVVGVSDETLRKYYDKELETAAAMMNAQVAQNLFSIATSKASGCVPAAIF
jgi:DNA-binding XRE family transcriptional regulator